METKRNKNATIALVLMVIGIIGLFAPNFDKIMYLFVGMIVLCVVQACFAKTAQKQIAANENETGMGVAKAAFFLGIAGAIFYTLGVMSLYMINDEELRNNVYCPQATNCVDNGDGTSTCMFSGMKINCKNVEETPEDLPVEESEESLQE